MDRIAECMKQVDYLGGWLKMKPEYKGQGMEIYLELPLPFLEILPVSPPDQFTDIYHSLYHSALHAKCIYK